MELTTSLKRGAIGGVLGGIVFGLMMQSMGMIPMIAKMVGSESLVVGWTIHMIISIIFGLGFGFIAIKSEKVILLGGIYGILLWIIGPLIIMPMMLGMGMQLTNAFEPDKLMSLGTHIFFGFMVGIVYKMLSTKRSQSVQLEA